MCPCHGGAYYRDGARASGPPERGLFEYPYKVENGLVTIQAGELPTPGAAIASLGGEKTPCAGSIKSRSQRSVSGSTAAYRSQPPFAKRRNIRSREILPVGFTSSAARQ